LKHDFNTTDAFGVFDQRRYGSITSFDLRDGLNAIGIFASQQECELFVTRYDTNGDKRLTQFEFSKAFEATDNYYASMVIRRPSNYVPRPIRREDVFLPGTVVEFVSMMRTHLRVESAAE